MQFIDSYVQKIEEKTRLTFLEFSFFKIVLYERLLIEFYVSLHLRTKGKQ